MGLRCLRCGHPLSGRQRDFCGRECKCAHDNERMLLGRHVLDMARIWRRYRRPGDFTRLTRMIDSLLEADRKSGFSDYREPPPHLLVRRPA